MLEGENRERGENLLVVLRKGKRREEGGQEEERKRLEGSGRGFSGEGFLGEVSGVFRVCEGSLGCVCGLCLETSRREGDAR